MSESRDVLIRLVQRHLIPVAITNGFEAIPLLEREQASREMKNAFPLGRMRRIRRRNFEIVEVQFDKGGRGKFVLNFGIIPPEGVEVPWQHSEQSKASIAGAREAYRLYASRHWMKWFSPARIAFPFDLETRSMKAIEKAVSLYPEIETWFARRVVSPYFRPHGYWAMSNSPHDS
jgi:hypothetical protein